MIDIHSHLLPGVDDGASDLAEAVAMCRLAAEDGCTAIVATPHLRHEQWWNDDRSLLEQRWLELRDAALPHLEVFLGGEIAINSQSCRELELLPEGDLVSLAGSRYLLLEFHPRPLGPDPVELIHELVVEGWTPIVAHPERIRWLAEDLGLLGALIDHGALAQLTAMSVTGDFGRHIQTTASRMLDASLVHFVASDAHSVRLRPPGLAKAFDHIAATRGEATARRLLLTHPRAVLENRPLASRQDLAEARPRPAREATESRPPRAEPGREPKRRGVVQWLSRGRR